VNENKMQPIIKLRCLTKYYGKSRGIEDLSLNINKGEIFGFLGPNGAGKSTTIRLMLNLLRPSSGTVEIFNKNVQKHYAEIFKHLNKADLNKKIKHYSHGMKQKLGIIQALQDDPDLVIMDEPSEGLDPMNKNILYEYLVKFKAAGKTIFFSSHYLAEVEKICDRVGLVRRGKLITQESISSLKEKMVRRLEVIFAQPVSARDFDLQNTDILEQNSHRLVLNVSADINQVLKQIAKYEIKNLVFPEPSLEDTFMAFYNKE